MDFTLTFEGDNSVQKAAAFKSFVEEQRPRSIEKLEVEQTPGKPGDQGIGTFLGSVITSIVDGTGFKDLIGLVGRFMELFDGRLVIKDGEGKSMVIPGGRKLTKEQIENIAIHFSNRQ
jgi:hypothetical protein